MNKSVLLLLWVLLLASCQQETVLPQGGATSKEVTVRVTPKLNNMVTGLPVSIDSSTTNSTRSVAALTPAIENVINDVWVFQYDAITKVLLKAQYLPVGTNFNDFSLSLVVNANCNIYFIANEGFNAYPFVVGTPTTNPVGAPALESDFLNSYKFYALESDLLKSKADVAGIPMCGSLLGKAVTAATFSTFSVTLKRLLARVDFTYSVDSKLADFTLSSLHVRNVPQVMSYLLPPATSCVYFKDWPYESGIAASPLPVTKTFYLPVNMQGSNSNTDPTNKAGIGFPCATYFELVGGTVGNLRFYSYYVGNGAGSYNVEADKYYKIAATIKGTSYTDKRVKSPMKLFSNCYIVSPWSSVTIDANIVTVARLSYPTVGIVALPADLSTCTASVLWDDKSTNGELESVCSKITDVSSNGFFTLAGIAHGNAVVVLKDSNQKILWSWHIWVTDYDGSSFDSKSAKDGSKFMDRNLGASTNVITDIGAYGLYYQWGRKDPFIGGTGTSQTAYGLADNIPINASRPEFSLLASIAAPNQFYINEADWCDTSESLAPFYYLWGNIKTVFDPCPLGWKVPSNIQLNGMFGNNVKSGYWECEGGFSEADVGGYWWSCSVNDYCAYFLNSNGDVNDLKRANGIPVRCVQDL